MSTTTIESEARSARAAGLLSRILDEGYGEGAWHGADLKQAISDVDTDLALWRPSEQRHNIAEIALHHAYIVRGVVGKLGVTPQEPFLLEGEDWFPVGKKGGPSWAEVRETLEREQSRLARLISDIDGGRVRTSLSEGERVDLVLGITCHAVYHAGQVQLLRKLRQ